MKKLDIPIISKTYELYILIHLQQTNIPKLERFTIWQKLQNTCLNTLENLILTGYIEQKNRLEQLIKVGVQIDLLRFFVRLSFDTKIINQKTYLKLQSQIDEIGRMLGGWIKSMKNK